MEKCNVQLARVFFMNKVTGIKKLHHLRFESSPGFAFVKERAGSQEWNSYCWLEARVWQATIPPAGLSLQHQWYLYKIRVLPWQLEWHHMPTGNGWTPRLITLSISYPSPIQSPIPACTPISALTDEPPAKRAVGQPRHNVRTCPNNSSLIIPCTVLTFMSHQWLTC